MVVIQVELLSGFRKADLHTIPFVSNQTILEFITKVTSSSSKETLKKASKEVEDADLRVDYIQVRKAAEICEARAIVFSAVTNKNIAAYSVSIKINTTKNEIIEASCENCVKRLSCPHILAFIFWLNRKSTDKDELAVNYFWGSETETIAEDEHLDAIRVRDMFACDKLRAECDMEAAGVSENDGNAFVDSVLDEMENQGLRDTALYQHCRPTIDEFESVFVHHTLLDSSNNMVKDTRSFAQYMEDQAKLGIFDRIAEITTSSYKSQLWLETQYLRLRCSLIHHIALRKSPQEDEQILQKLFCRDRELNVAERQQLKQHKRFILKQTEKLENKTYSECGILLNESYPYICATPDGITDDHIVEIKAPKTEEQFENYLECRETIAPRFMAQIQIQMYMANVTRALYCVLSPTFDTNGALHYVWVQADMEFVAGLLSAAEDFWKEVVFPRLTEIYFNHQ